MAPTLIQSATGTKTSGGTWALMFTGAVTAGHGVVVTLGTIAANTTTVVSSGGSDTFTRIANSLATQTAIFYLTASTGGYTQINFSGSSSDFPGCFFGYEFSTPLLLDRTATTGRTSATSWTSGSTATTTTATEVWVGIGYGDDYTDTSEVNYTMTGPASPWHNLSALYAWNATVTTTTNAISGYDLVTATAAAAYAGTISNALGSPQAMVATFSTVLPVIPPQARLRRGRLAPMQASIL